MLIPEDKAQAMLDFARTAPDGAIVEVGVFMGGSLRWLARSGRQCYGYDTFAGMPFLCKPEIDDHHGGDFPVERREVIKSMADLPNVMLIPGVYPGSDYICPQPVALAHVDVDLYESTLSALRHLWPLMAKGGRIYMDDVFTETCRGATMAMCEFAVDCKTVPHYRLPTFFFEK